MVDGGRERIEVKEVNEARVEETLLDRVADVTGETRLVQQRELEFRLVAAEHALVDHLAQQPRRDDVEVGVVLDVLHRDADRGLVELLGGDAVKQRDAELRRHLRGHGDLVRQANSCALDRLVDAVGVVRLSRAITLGDVDARTDAAGLDRRLGFCSGVLGDRHRAPLLCDRWALTGHKICVIYVCGVPSDA